MTAILRTESFFTISLQLFKLSQQHSAGWC